MKKITLWALIFTAIFILGIIPAVALGKNGGGFGALAILAFPVGVVLWLIVLYRYLKRNQARFIAATTPKTTTPRQSFTSKKKKTYNTPYVSCTFRALTSDRPATIHSGYTYRWDLPSDPVAGMRVIVPDGDDKPAPTVIGAINVIPEDGDTEDIKTVTRIVTDEEIHAAHVALHKDEEAWLDMARREADLPSKTRRQNPPAGLPEIPPADGRATEEDANEYGRAWWRVFKTGEEHELPKEELTRFKSIAYRWFAVRKKGGNLH